MGTQLINVAHYQGGKSENFRVKRPRMQGDHQPPPQSPSESVNQNKPTWLGPSGWVRFEGFL